MKLDGAGLFYGELLNAWLANEPSCGPVGEPYFVVVLRLLGVDHLPDKVPARVTPAVQLPVVAGMLQCQHTGLVQGDISQGLTRRVELELLFLFLFLFCHCVAMFPCNAADANPTLIDGAATSQI